jgi:hypothetical protein
MFPIKVIQENKTHLSQQMHFLPQNCVTCDITTRNIIDQDAKAISVYIQICCHVT